MGKYQGLSPDERAAEKAISGISAIGTPRHNHKNDGKVHSLGTAKQYKQTFKMASRFCREQGTRLNKLTVEKAQQYLESRSLDIQQKQLNNERIALQYHLNNLSKKPPVKLDFVVSQRAPPEAKARAYSREQVQQLVQKSDPKMAVSIAVAYTAGLRAEELYTIARSSEQSPSPHRRWNIDVYSGRENWISYTVTGKGGLSREVRIPQHLADRLEQFRRPEPTYVHDKGRGNSYESRYDLVAGSAFSKRFSDRSNQEFFYSTGAHGLRHSYAQERIKSLQNNGHELDMAERILAQELGHFDTSNLCHYFV